MHIFAVFILALTKCLTSADDPILETHIGKFEGRNLVFDGDRRIEAFYGVPFAKPPTGSNRFERPVDAEKSNKTRKAVEKKPGCLQYPITDINDVPRSEDCLYMNVFKPQEKSKDGYPVLIFIHGGAFQVGSAHVHSLDAVANNFAAEKIVFIVPQYRLNILGFGATGPEAFSGNYGLWDLRQALLWVRKNAKVLDINIKRITIGGYSAGSAAVGMLTMSEHTRDLFSQALQMSGSPFAEWAMSNRAITLTEKIAGNLDCDFASSSDSDDLDELNGNFFTPRLDAEFFRDDLPQLIESSPPKPTLATITANEGILFTCFDLEIFFLMLLVFGKTGILDNHYLDDNQFKKFDKKAFERFVSEKVATEKLFGSKAAEVQKKIVKFYVGTSNTSDPFFYQRQHAKLISDVLFVVPQLREMHYKMEAGWPVFMLKNVHWKPFLWAGKNAELFKESTHAQEYGLLFGLTQVYRGELDEDDKKSKKLLVEAILNFVKNRTPKTDDNAEFLTIDKKHPLVYTEISTEAKIKAPLFGEELNFWNKMTKDYEFDLIRGIHQKSLKSRTEL